MAQRICDRRCQARQLVEPGFFRQRRLPIFLVRIPCVAAPFQRFKHIVDIAETGAPESVLDIVRALLGCQEIVFEITEFKHAHWYAALVPGAMNQRRQVAQAKPGDRNRAPQCSRLRYGRRSSARPQGDRRGAGDGWRVRPPAAGDPRTAYPQGALHRTAEANRIAWHAIAASHSWCRSPAGFPMRTGQSSPSEIGYM
jgi:hypothetical protein